MKWVADAEMTGVMAGIGSSILKGFAEKKVREIFDGHQEGDGTGPASKPVYSM